MSVVFSFVNKAPVIEDFRRKMVLLLEDQKKRVDIVLVKLNPSASTSWHYHKKTIEFFYCLRGRGWLKYEDLKSGEGSEKALKKGVCFFIYPLTAHQLKACSKKPLIFLKINLPAFKKEDIYEAPK